MLLPFAKYHGLGNDFAIVDARALDLTFPGLLGQKLCDRFRGIGADGVLVWTGTLAAPAMTVVNADGSVAEMCGNGLRCFVKYLLDRHLPDASALTVRTGNGPLHCVVTRDRMGAVDTVAVAMGTASLAAAQIPLAQPQPLVEQPVQVGERGVTLTAVSMGNPHAVTFDAIATQDRALLGPLLGRHPLFPQSANIGFAQVLQGDAPRLELHVFERGSGWTQACGTGATAAAVAAVETGRLPANTEIGVKLPGGWLAITVTDDRRTTMRGPAVHVFRVHGEGGIVVGRVPDLGQDDQVGARGGGFLKRIERFLMRREKERRRRARTRARLPPALSPPAP